jgi:phospholipid/cholesterol/gamma-HCH transport system substrate-binding protein
MRRARVAATALLGLAALTGCSFKGAYSLPLPGGAAHGKTYHVTAVFSDVQDLTVQAAVRVNDVAVGDVTSITLDPADLKAHVGMSINASVHLPANAVATLEQTTLLGEKFVAIAPPSTTPPQGTLANDAVITNASSTELPSVEEVFGLLSQVLNGGDLADLQTINVEITKALAGREQQVRGALTQLNTFVSGLAQQKQQIVRALDELNRFTGALRAQDATIATALTDLGPGLRVLADERAQFTALLTHLSRFGKVASHIIHASRTQTIQGLRDLQPILGHLAAAGSALPRSLEILITFPFPRDSSQASPGDYTNFQANLNLSPILCEAVAGLGSTDLLTLINQNPLLTTLGIKNCPKPGSVSGPTSTNGTAVPPVTGAGTPPSSGNGSPGATGQSGGSNGNGLEQLLGGLGQGGGR